MPAAEVEHFAAEYVSLFALARQQRHFQAVKQELEATGAESAFDPQKIGATFYRKASSEGQ